MNRFRKLKFWKRRSVKVDIKVNELFNQIEQLGASFRKREIAIVEKLKLQNELEATLRSRILVS